MTECSVTCSWVDISQQMLLAQGNLELNPCTEAHWDGEEQDDSSFWHSPACRGGLAEARGAGLPAMHRGAAAITTLTYISPSIST